MLRKVICKFYNSERKFRFRGSVAERRAREEHFPNEQPHLVPTHLEQIKEEENGPPTEAS